MVYHIPVLLDEVLNGLQVRPGGVYVDCTVGEGGHSTAIMESCGPTGKLLGLDLDGQALGTAIQSLETYGCSNILVNDNFGNLVEIASKKGFDAVDGILFDLGLSSLQLEGEGKGFSFNLEEPLDMRFDSSQDLTAAHVVNEYSDKELIDVIRKYGEEPRARNITRAIVANRPIENSLALAQIVKRAATRKWSRTHPATRTFQAIRIEVNGELQNIECALHQTIPILKPGGRLVVISYHSLEDRIVKGFLRQESRESENFRLINKKIISPSQEEVKANFRSRSARMRVAERI
jgi:16S rRNA (cytosine1402-N4)-methyltransferase